MNRQLTQEEIDAAFASTGATSDSRSAVKSFDFARLDRLPKTQIRAVQQLHENFIRNVSSSLAAYLRTYVRMNLVSTEEISYAEFMDGFASPTLLAFLGLRPYDGVAVMELSPGLVFTMLEMLLGGAGKPMPGPWRKVTDVEKELMQSLFRILLRGLHEAWASVVEVDFDVQFLADEANLVNVLSPAEAVVAIGIEAQVGETTEMINLAIPSIFIKQLRHMFDRLRRVQKAEPRPSEQLQIAELLRAVDLELEVRLDGCSVLTRDLLNLKPGDVLQLDYPVTKKAAGVLNGEQRFWGTLTRTGQTMAYAIASEYEKD